VTFGDRRHSAPTDVPASDRHASHQRPLNQRSHPCRRSYLLWPSRRFWACPPPPQFHAFSLRTRALTVRRSRVTPTAIPTVVQLGPHTANMLAVETADPVADNEASASMHTDASLRRQASRSLSPPSAKPGCRFCSERHAGGGGRRRAAAFSAER